MSANQASGVFGPRTIDTMRKRLETARRELMAELDVTEDELHRIAEERESELEERSQSEAAADVLTRLEEHDFRRVREVLDALDRMADGSYGLCAECGKRILLTRLRAMPAARLCGACALADEQPWYAPKATVVSTGPEGAMAEVPAELRELSDAELAELIREQFLGEVGDALESLRVVCRHGRVTLGGEVASDELRQVALRIVEEEIGLETVDRVRVTGLAGERPHAETKEVPVGFGDDRSSENLFDVSEEGLDYSPPTRPTPESE